MREVKVKASTDYSILIEKGILAEAGKYIAQVEKSRKCVIVTDDNVEKLYGHDFRKSLRKEGFQVSTFVFLNGEKSKNMSTLASIFDFLVEKDITRSDFLIALGGGVVGDITGFAAACYQRGIDYIQVPTTLLAQVDSSVGGKTAVDLECGKNLVGAFKQPQLVLCDPETLDTLSDEIFADGMGEVIKYGMIRSNSLFETLEQNDSESIKSIICDIIEESVSIKRDVVEADEKEAGLRMILNFGHTVGHAIESYYNYRTYTHGSAVAIGMCIMSSVSADKNITDRLIECVKKYSLPYETEAPLEALLPLCGHDKKRSSSALSFIVCEKIGEASVRKLEFSDFVKYMEGKE